MVAKLLGVLEVGGIGVDCAQSRSEAAYRLVEELLSSTGDVDQGTFGDEQFGCGERDPRWSRP